MTDDGHALARILDSAAIQVREMQRLIDAKDAEIDRLAKVNGEQCDRIFELEQQRLPAPAPAPTPCVTSRALAEAINAPSAETVAASRVGDLIVIAPTPIADEDIVDLKPRAGVRRRVIRDRRLLLVGDPVREAIPLTSADEARLLREERADG